MDEDERRKAKTWLRAHPMSAADAVRHLAHQRLERLATAERMGAPPCDVWRLLGLMIEEAEAGNIPEMVGLALRLGGLARPDGQTLKNEEAKQLLRTGGRWGEDALLRAALDLAE